MFKNSLSSLNDLSPKPSKHWTLASFCFSNFPKVLILFSTKQLMTLLGIGNSSTLVSVLNSSVMTISSDSVFLALSLPDNSSEIQAKCWAKILVASSKASLGVIEPSVSISMIKRL